MLAPKRDRERYIGAVMATVSVVVLAFGTVAVGVSVSRHTGNWTWFSRSGSVLVVIGLIYAYFNVDRWMERSLRRTTATLQRAIDASAPRLSVFRGWLEALRRQTAAHIDDIPNTVRVVEIVTILSGTLIWGFGDLIGLI